ncbi:hypothetical protein FS827_22340 [Agrobacterium vitis]|uniref:hypothetical protein n=1 Tax=Allorhizobium ampelinum TaxID=3025782 RepID=UPI001F2031D7|nr:hypothetical protein [Allorhizobium ampelinum]MCF1464047.1 hypothetical protein [Allorhizobium ampelinum]
MSEATGRKRGWALGRKVPRASELLRAILTTVEGGPFARKNLRKLVAREVGFQTRDMATRHEDEGGASFNDSFHHAIQHLIDEKMVVLFDKRLSLAASIRDQARTVRIPQMPDYQVGSTNRPLTSSTSWPVNNQKLETELPGYTVEQLVVTYEAAEKRYSELEGNEKKLGKRINALGVQLRVRQEFIRRGFFSEDDEVGEFRWPTTVASGGNGTLVLQELPAIGPLKALGYAVGKGSPGPAQRHQLLTKAFLQDLPEVEGVKEWGANDSSRRLQKMAESIAAFVRNAKRRRKTSWDDAIVRWENDLEYLRVKHYVGRFDGAWAFPTTTI